jgi:hypothetical protein
MEEEIIYQIFKWNVFTGKIINFDSWVESAWHDLSLQYGHDVGVSDQTFTLYEVGDEHLIEVSMFGETHSN